MATVEEETVVLVALILTELRFRAVKARIRFAPEHRWLSTKGVVRTPNTCDQSPALPMAYWSRSDQEHIDAG